MRKKIEVKEPYVPRPMNEIYIYIQKGNPNRLTPVPWSCKPNYKYLLPLIKNLND